MNKFISKIFKSAGVNAKVSKDSVDPRFKVTEKDLTLEGKIRQNRYQMSIKDQQGSVIDSVSVIVKDSNDIVNRITESINTLKMLSTAYSDKKLVEENEEFDDVTIEEEEPKDLVSGLAELYDKILDVAEIAESLVEAADEDDANTLNTLIGFASSLYDTAIDVDDFREDLIEEEDQEVEEENIKTPKSVARRVVENLTISEALIKKDASLKDITRAIKDIKSELIVRGL